MLLPEQVTLMAVGLAGMVAARLSRTGGVGGVDSN